MCGILLTNRAIVNLGDALMYLEPRGPDHTSLVRRGDYTFIHTLLSITGEVTPQPFVNDSGDVMAIYNGEIYNYHEFGEVPSDGLCLISAYEKYGDDFVCHLDGEFALVLIDFEQMKLIFSTDVFSTKPMWFASEGVEFGISSYEHPLQSLGFNEPIQVEANSTYVVDLDTLTVKSRKDVHTFDLRQHKTNFDDWNSAFSDAIAKRTQNLRESLFIGLSSGYDSGAIACELTRQEVDFFAYSIVGSEPGDTIRARLNRINKGEILEFPLDSFIESKNRLKEFTDQYYLTIDNGEQRIIDSLQQELTKLNHQLESNKESMDLQKRHKKDGQIGEEIIKTKRKIDEYLNVLEYRKHSQLLADDNGAIGLNFIVEQGVRDGRKVYLSGSGADEIFSDYGFMGVRHYSHSTLGGLFPDKLESVFPWKNFFDNTQRAYLAKEEYICGANGVEGRYPFLDAAVVQEFLWLTPSMKNQYYKSVLRQFLVQHDFPFDENKKLGFNCGFTSNMGSIGPFSEGGTYKPIESTMDPRLRPFTSVGVPFDEFRVVEASQWQGNSGVRYRPLRILDHLTK